MARLLTLRVGGGHSQDKRIGIINNSHWRVAYLEVGERAVEGLGQSVRCSHFCHLSHMGGAHNVFDTQSCKSILSV